MSEKFKLPQDCSIGVARGAKEAMAPPNFRKYSHFVFCETFF